MGTRDGSKQTPPPVMREWADKNIPMHKKDRPGKVPVTQRTKYEDTEQTIEHNPLSGRPKTA